MSPKRHGSERLRQKENAAGRIVGHQQQGMHKKLANLSIGQLRNMFPMYAHLPESELRSAVLRELSKR